MEDNKMFERKLDLVGEPSRDTRNPYLKTVGFNTMAVDKSDFRSQLVEYSVLDTMRAKVTIKGVKLDSLQAKRFNRDVLDVTLPRLQAMFDTRAFQEARPATRQKWVDGEMSRAKKALKDKIYRGDEELRQEVADKEEAKVDEGYRKLGLEEMKDSDKQKFSSGSTAVRNKMRKARMLELGIEVTEGLDIEL